MRTGFLFLLTVLYTSIFSQVTEELIYPVVPIADECHYAFDNQDSIQVISIEDFQKIDSIWTTFNSCLGYEEGRENAASYGIQFRSAGKEIDADFFIHDGYLKTEYQSSLVTNIKNIKPFDHILFTDINYERGGAMYQVKDVHMVIDSIVVPKLDTCWQYFSMSPISPYSSINVTKEQFKKLLLDSFGFNHCLNTKEWLDTSVKVQMTIAPRAVSGGMSVNIFIDSYDVNNLSDFSKVIKSIDQLSYADNIVFNKTIYLKEGEYRYVPEYRFNIIDQAKCESTFSLINSNLDSLTSLILKIQKGEIAPVPCFVNENGNPLSFSLILSSQDGNLMASSTGKISGPILSIIKRAKSGDQILIERLQNTNPYENKKSNYKSIVITLP